MTAPDFWGILVPPLMGKSFYTLRQGHEFRVEEMGDHHLLIITSTGQRRRIARRELEGAWQELVQKGKITWKEIWGGLSPFNPAYVASLLAHIEGVTYTASPITLRYQGGS